MPRQDTILTILFLAQNRARHPKVTDKACGSLTQSQQYTEEPASLLCSNACLLAREAMLGSVSMLTQDTILLPTPTPCNSQQTYNIQPPSSPAGLSLPCAFPFAFKFSYLLLLSFSFVWNLYFNLCPSEFQKHWLAKSFRFPFSTPVKQIRKIVKGYMVLDSPLGIIEKPTIINPPPALLACPCPVLSLF